MKKPAAKKAAKKDSSDDDSSEEEKPVTRSRKQSNVSAGKKAAKKESDEEFEVVKNGHAVDEDEDKKELFVGNLSFHTTEDSLAAAFGEYGTVVNVKLPQQDGRPKGFAFVEFATHKEAQAALDAYNG